MKNPLRSALQPFADTHAEGWLVAATFAASALQGSAFSYPLPQVVVAEVVAVGGPSPGVQRFLSINGDEEGSWVASARAPTYSDQVLYGVLAGSGTTTPGILRAPQVIGGYDQALVTQGRVLAGRIAYTSLTFVQPVGYSSWIDDDLLAASGMAIGTTGMQWTDSFTPRLTKSTESFVLGRAIPTGTTAPPVELVVRYPDESIVLLEGGNVQGLSGPVTDIWSFETSPSGEWWVAVVWYDSSTTGQEEMAVVLDGTVYLLTNFNRAWTETGAFESFAGAHVNDDREVTFLARDQTSDLVYRHRYRAFRGGLRRLVDVDRNGLVLSTPFYDQGLSVDLEGMSLDRPGVGGVDANGDGSPNVGWYVNGPAMAVPRASFVGDGEVLIVTSLRVPGAGSQDAIVRANLAQPADIVCVGVPNSYGATATLRAIGSDEVSFNDLELRMTYVPSGSVLLPLVSSTTGFTANPGGSHGNLCLGGAIGRGSPFPNVPWASQTLRVYPNSLPQPNGTTAAQAGQTWYFQVWYRDTQGTAPGSNFTSALGVTFR